MSATDASSKKKIKYYGTKLNSLYLISINCQPNTTGECSGKGKSLTIRIQNFNANYAFRHKGIVTSVIYDAGFHTLVKYVHHTTASINV